jgi:tRNA nucleotidyltransferase/poly(A) polymerase
MLPISPDIFSSITPRGAYVVGGSVRDMLLERPAIDYDIAVDDNPEQFARRLATSISGHYVEIGKPGLMLHRVVAGDLIFDISPIAGSSIEDDLRQRDFTINAMAYDISAGEIIDCMNSGQDLDKKIVRMVAPSVFKHDPVRLIRAFRMAATLSFEIDPATQTAVGEDAGLIADSAGERIWTELYKILDTENSHHSIQQMAACGLLEVILPDMTHLRGCRQDDRHRFDVFDHTLSAYDHLERLLQNRHSGFSLPTATNGPVAIGMPDPVIKFAMLLHDIGKPVTRFENYNGRVHFYGHGRKGATIAKGISHRLKLSRRETGNVDFIVRNHLRPLHLFTSMQRVQLSPKAVTRFFVHSGSRTPALLLHSLADVFGKSKTDNGDHHPFAEFISELMESYFANFKPRKQDPPLLSGKDLINTFGLTPSPLFATILARTEEARLAGLINSKEEAERWVEGYLKKEMR